MARIRVKTVPLTATNLTNHVLAVLRSDGHACRRINTVGVYDEKLKIRRKVKKTERGTSDIIACMSPIGLFAGIEIKIGDDEQSKDQYNFEVEVKNAGGHYVLIKTPEDFNKWYASIKDLINYINQATQFI